jgi:NADPH:quinone reductase-like Zn-dependent oxidoreductase
MLSSVRAVVFDRYGPPEVLRLEEVEKPTPADNEILVRVHATTVTRTDVGLRSAEFLPSRFYTGLLRPKQRILGFELAGEVEAIGASVKEFKIGDRVFGIARSGAHAEFAVAAEDGPIAHMPDGIGFDMAAAASDGAALALACLRKADELRGRRVLVYGASGAVGTAGVQLAKHFGAHVTAVCSTRHVELVRSLGADAVIDYTTDDFTKNGERYDVVFDAVGKFSFRRARRSLRAGGTFVDTDLGFLLHLPWLMLLTRWVGDKKVTMGITRYSKEDALLLRELMEAGKFRPVIDRNYPLEDFLAATRYVESGRKTGNVVLTVSG